MRGMEGRRPAAGGWIVSASLLAAALGGCGDLPFDGGSPTIEATGAVAGSIFLDVDGSGAITTSDRPAPSVRVRLVTQGGLGEVAEAVTDSVGVFRMSSVPVGSFRLQLDSTALSDSLIVTEMDTSPFTLARGDTVIRHIQLAYPTADFEEISSLPPGRRVFTHGIALNQRVPFGDGVVHLRLGDSYLRALEVDRSSLQPGDSVRFLGTTASDQGRPVIRDVRPFILVAQAALVEPVELTSAMAATGGEEGRLDAALVRIRSANILDTLSVGPDLVVTADDGSGPVEIVLRDFLTIDRAPFRPDSTAFIQATGLLVPVRSEDGEARWRLTPRAASDLSLGPPEYPTVELGEIPSLPPGQRVFTHGIVLNQRVPFGDGVVHLRLGDSYLRALDVDRSSLQPGDSVRFLGTTAADQGRAVLRNVRPFILVAQAALVQPLEVTSTTAASGGEEGSLDAALVRIRSANILDTLSVGQDFVVTADDGSGPVEVVIRGFLSINRAPFQPDSTAFVQATGLLVPFQSEDGETRWRLTPRAAADLTLGPPVSLPDG